MAFSKKNMNEMFGTVLVLSALLSTASAVDCQGKSFHCVNSTHFMICVDLGGGVSQSIDNFFIPCPPTTVCQSTNHFECEGLAPTTPSTTLSETTSPWEEVVTATLPPGNTTKEFSEKYMNTERITTAAEDSFTTDATVEFTTATTSDFNNNNELNNKNITETLAIVAKNKSTTTIEIATQPTIQNINLTETVPVVAEAAQLPTKAVETVTQRVIENFHLTEIIPAVAEKNATTAIEAVTNTTTAKKNLTDILVTDNPKNIAIETATQSKIETINVTVSTPVSAEKIAVQNMNVTVTEPELVVQELATTAIEMVTQATTENSNVTETEQTKSKETADTVIIDPRNLTETKSALAFENLTTISTQMITQPSIETTNLTETVRTKAEEIAPAGMETINDTINEIKIETATELVVAAEEPTTTIEKIATATELIVAAEEPTTTIEMIVQPLTEKIYATNTEPHNVKETEAERRNLTSTRTMATTDVITLAQTTTENIVTNEGVSTEAKYFPTPVLEQVTQTITDSLDMVDSINLNIDAPKVIVMFQKQNVTNNTLLEKQTTENITSIARKRISVALNNTIAKNIDMISISNKATETPTDASLNNILVNESTASESLIDESTTKKYSEEVASTIDDWVGGYTTENPTTSTSVNAFPESTTIDYTIDINLDTEKTIPVTTQSVKSIDAGHTDTASTINMVYMENSEKQTIHEENFPTNTSQNFAAMDTTTSPTVYLDSVTTEIPYTPSTINEGKSMSSVSDNNLTTGTTSPASTNIEYTLSNAESVHDLLAEKPSNLELILTDNNVKANGIHVPVDGSTYTYTELPTNVIESDLHKELATDTVHENVITTDIVTSAASRDLTVNIENKTPNKTSNIILNATDLVSNASQFVNIASKLLPSGVPQNNKNKKLSPQNIFELRARQIEKSKQYTNLVKADGQETFENEIKPTSGEKDKFNKSGLVSQIPVSIIAENVTNSYVNNSQQSNYSIATESSIEASSSNYILSINTVLENTINSGPEIENQPTQLDILVTTDPTFLKTDTTAIDGIDNILVSTQASVAENTIIDGVHNINKPTGNIFNIPPESPANNTVNETFTPPESNFEEPSVIQGKVSVTPEAKSISTYIHGNVPTKTVPTVTDLRTNDNSYTETSGVEIATEIEVVTSSKPVDVLPPQTNNNILSTPVTYVPLMSDSTSDSQTENTVIITESYKWVTLNPTSNNNRKEANVNVGDLFTVPLDGRTIFNPQTSVSDRANDMTTVSGAFPPNFQTTLADGAGDITQGHRPGSPTFSYQSAISDAASDINTFPITGAPTFNVQTDATDRSSDVPKIYSVGGYSINSRSGINDAASGNTTAPITGAPTSNAQAGVTDRSSDVTKVHTVGGYSINSQPGMNNEASGITAVPITGTPISNAQGGVTDRSSDIKKVNTIGGSTINTESEMNNEASGITAVSIAGAPTLYDQAGVTHMYSDVTKVHTVGGYSINSQSGMTDGVRGITAVPTSGAPTFNAQAGVTDRSSDVTKVHTDGGYSINSQSGMNDGASGITAVPITGAPTFYDQTGVIHTYSGVTKAHTVGGYGINSQSGMNDGASSITAVPISGTPISNAQAGAIHTYSDVTKAHTVAGYSINSQSGMTDGVRGITAVPTSGAPTFNAQAGVTDRSSDVTKVHTDGGYSINSQSGMNDGASGITAVPITGAPTFYDQTGVIHTYSGVTKAHTVGGYGINSQSGMNDGASSITAVPISGTPISNAQAGAIHTYSDVTKAHTVAGYSINSQSGMNVGASSITAVPTSGAPTFSAQAGVTDRSSDVTKVHTVGGYSINSQPGMNDGASGITADPIAGAPTFYGQTGVIHTFSDVTKAHTVGDYSINSQSGMNDGESGITAIPISGAPLSNAQAGVTDRSNDVTKVHTVGGYSINSQSGMNDGTSGITAVPIAGAPTFYDQAGVIHTYSDVTKVHTVGGYSINSQSGMNDGASGITAVPISKAPISNAQAGVIDKSSDVTKVHTVEGHSSNLQKGINEGVSDIAAVSVPGAPTLNAQTGVNNTSSNVTKIHSVGLTSPGINSQSGNIGRATDITTDQTTGVVAFNSESQNTEHSIPRNDSLTVSNIIKTELPQGNSYATITVPISKQTPKTNKSYTSTVHPPTKTVTPTKIPPVANNLNKQVPNDTSQTYTCINGIRGRYSDKSDCRKFYICVGNNQPIVGYCPENTVFSDLKKLCTKNMSHCIRDNQFKCPSAGRFSDVMNDNVYYICVNHKNHLYRFKFQCQKGYVLNKITVKCIETKEIESNESTSISAGDSSSQSDSISTTSSSSNSASNNSSKNSNISSSKDKSSKSKKSKEATEKPEEKEEDDEDDVFKCEKEGKFPVRNDCRRYYLCKKNRKSEYRRKVKKCDSGDVFHKNKKKCVDADSYEC